MTMTTLEALRQSVNYPLSDGQVEPILIQRGLDSEDDFSQEIAAGKAYRLAYADVLRFVVTMVNLSQGGSITQAVVGELRGTANAIYRQYGEPLIGETAEKKSTIRDISDFW